MNDAGRENTIPGLRGYKERTFVICAVLFILFNVFVASLVRNNDNQYMAGTAHPAGMMLTGEIHCKNKGVMVTPILGVKWLCENDTTFGVSNGVSAWLVS